jgi:hypothetical protein
MGKMKELFMQLREEEDHEQPDEDLDLDYQDYLQKLQEEEHLKEEEDDNSRND